MYRSPVSVLRVSLLSLLLPLPQLGCGNWEDLVLRTWTEVASGYPMSWYTTAVGPCLNRGGVF